MEAETQRQLSEKEHQKSAAIFEAAKQKVLLDFNSFHDSLYISIHSPFNIYQYQYLEKDLKSAIQKSRPYFGWFYIISETRSTSSIISWVI